jgi:prepilin-type N-terminal cleavage/methylation domain-containing protein
MRRGFTLFEVIASIVVSGIIIYAVLAIYITSGFKGINVEIYTVAQMLAEDKLEEVMVKDFANVTSASQTNFSGDLSNYSHQIVVNYVQGSNLNNPVGGPTEYKKIRVMIRHTKLTNPVTLESIRANY